MIVESGTCRACGRDLVRTPERVYHPASVTLAMGIDGVCSALLPIPGSTHLSNDVTPNNFIPS